MVLKENEDGSISPQMVDKPSSLGTYDGVFLYEGKLTQLGVVCPDSVFIPSLCYRDLLPEFRKFLPVTDKYVVAAKVIDGRSYDIVHLALVDYQEPMSKAVLPYINEWYRRHLEIVAQKKRKNNLEQTNTGTQNPNKSAC